LGLPNIHASIFPEFYYDTIAGPQNDTMILHFIVYSEQRDPSVKLIMENRNNDVVLDMHSWIKHLEKSARFGPIAYFVKVTTGVGDVSFDQGGIHGRSPLPTEIIRSMEIYIRRRQLTQLRWCRHCTSALGGPIQDSVLARN
jgi:hypothetical protein